MAAHEPAGAGVVDGSQTVDSTVVFLGVVPAAVTRNHPADHVERTMHGGVPGTGVHTFHLVTAVFERGTGRRITNATVTARLPGGRGRVWSVPLKPMTINGMTTYGGYTAIGTGLDGYIYVDVVRPIAGRHRRVTARFRYEHD
jgi:hypothetical protein